MTAGAAYTRVVLGLSGPTSSAAFAAAAEIAHSFEAELAGLFLEDETVLNISDLPFCVEIASAGLARPFRRGDAEAGFRSGFQAARRSLESAARRALVRHSLARERGSVAEILARVARAGDIIVFAEPERAIERACFVNIGYFAAAFACRGSLLYLPAAARAWTGGVTAGIGGPGDRDVLAAAARIAASRGVTLTVLAAKGVKWRSLLRSVLSGTRLRLSAVQEQLFDAASIEDLVRAAAGRPDDLLVVAHDRARLAMPEMLHALARSRRAPILLIEPTAASA